jgi:hypothetical protein
VTPSEEAVFADMERRDQLGRTGTVGQENGRNVFRAI